MPATNRKIQEKLPETMRAVRQHGQGGALTIETVPLPEPGPGEVLIRIQATPINPSDLAMIRGNTLVSRYPYTPGLEGSGIVVKAGSGLFPALRKGKRVACTPVPGKDGAWAEYMVTSAMRCSPLPAHIAPEEGSMMLVNPMTALAFIDMARKGKHLAIVNNVAASALGKMLIRLSVKYDVPLINIVRKESQVEALEQLGAAYVLNSNEDGFREKLRQLARDLGATLVLDAVAGRQTSGLLEVVPRGSRLIVYARLSGEDISLDPALLIRDDKQLSGFYLGNWLQSKNLLFKMRLVHRVGRLLPDILASPVSRKMPLESVEEALHLYTESMSAGKILLIPAQSHRP
ncbi:MAG TPA: hypothetical protein ENO20_09220 [Bacteroides sp.]|nr:hypothetical protein [Bacteroides sp.]